MDTFSRAAQTTGRNGPQEVGTAQRPKGGLLAALSRLIGDAFTMAYVAPYANLRHPSRVAPDDDLGGRDADW